MRPRCPTSLPRSPSGDSASWYARETSDCSRAVISSASIGNDFEPSVCLPGLAEWRLAGYPLCEAQTGQGDHPKTVRIQPAQTGKGALAHLHSKTPELCPHREEPGPPLFLSPCRVVWLVYGCNGQVQEGQGVPSSPELFGPDMVRPRRLSHKIPELCRRNCPFSARD